MDMQFLSPKNVCVAFMFIGILLLMTTLNYKLSYGTLDLKYFSKTGFDTDDPRNIKLESNLNSLHVDVVDVLKEWEKNVLSQLEDYMHDFPQTDMDDPHLVSLVQGLIHPPRSSGIWKLSHPSQSTKQAESILKVLNDKKKGFFVECGALDGERSSNTLDLEKMFGWSGILVEMDPYFFVQMLGKNRKSYTLHACLSPTQHPDKLEFREHELGSGKLQAGTGTSVVCIPFYTILLALNQTTVDYFSLDVEGQEFAILKTIPFSLLDIKTLSVEYIHLSQEDRDGLVKFMQENGYVLHETIDFADGYRTVYTNDYIFVKEGLI